MLAQSDGRELRGLMDAGIAVEIGSCPGHGQVREN